MAACAVVGVVGTVMVLCWQRRPDQSRSAPSLSLLLLLVGVVGGEGGGAWRGGFVSSEHTTLLLPTVPARTRSTTQDLAQSPTAAAAAAGRGGEAQHGCWDQGAEGRGWGWEAGRLRGAPSNGRKEWRRGPSSALWSMKGTEE